MKKIVLLAAIAATLTFTACNSCSDNSQTTIVPISETEKDSLYMVNDSTVADKQTFVFEGLMPMNDGTIADVVLTIKALNLNEDGTYKMSNTYMNGITPQTMNDSGEAMILIGMPNDSTAVIYELISDNDYPRTRLKINSDSSLTKLNSKMEAASNNPSHKLIHKK